MTPNHPPSLPSCVSWAHRLDHLSRALLGLSAEEFAQGVATRTIELVGSARDLSALIPLAFEGGVPTVK